MDLELADKGRVKLSRFGRNSEIAERKAEGDRESEADAREGI